MKKTYLKALLFTSLFLTQTAYSACISQLAAAAKCAPRSDFVTSTNTKCVRMYGSAKCNNSYAVLENGSHANLWTFRADANYNACIRLNMGICEFNAQRMPTSGTGDDGGGSQ